MAAMMLLVCTDTSLASESLVPLDTTSSSGLESAGSSQRAVPDAPGAASSSPALAAASPAAAQIPVYTVGSDDEEDLTVVSSEGEAREAQVHFFLLFV